MPDACGRSLKRSAPNLPPLPLFISAKAFMASIDDHPHARPAAPSAPALPAQQVSEELASSITHGVGLLVSIAGLVGLIVAASLHGSIWNLVACTVYGSTLIVLYTASTCYHMTRAPRLKRTFRLIDHAAIYLLIAGTYTPFTLITLRGPWGWTLFGMVWSLAILGIAFKVIYGHRQERLSLGIYLGMGWMCVIAARPILTLIPMGALVLLVAGGAAYTAGTFFFARDQRVKYYHAVWHLFVLLGSALHYCAIFYYVLPAVRQ